jgi:hypothetical protein
VIKKRWHGKAKKKKKKGRQKKKDGTKKKVVSPEPESVRPFGYMMVTIAADRDIQLHHRGFGCSLVMKAISGFNRVS